MVSFSRPLSVKALALENLKMLIIDPEKLISAVQARPALYDKNDILYYTNKNQNHKETMWLEVAEEALEDPEVLKKDKVKVVKEVQRRWRSLRSGFVRELAMQRRVANKRAEGKGYIKRRKTYEYFYNLLFLKDEIKIKDNENDAIELSRKYTNEQIFLYDEHSEASKEEIMKEIKPEVPNDPDDSDCEVIDTKSVISENSDNVDKNVPGTVIKMEIEVDDQDKQFALSLVPSLKKLDCKRNLEAKIQILKAIQAITYKRE